MPLALKKYILKQFALWFVIVVSAFSCIIFLFDLVELLRKARNKVNIDFFLIVKMSCFHVPSILEQILPFILLFSTFLTINRFIESSEIIAMRSSGRSVWQIMSPIFIFLVALTFMHFFILNPLVAAFSEKFEQYDNRYFKNKPNTITISDTGLWFRQEKPGSHTIIIRIGAVEREGQKLKDINLFYFKENGEFSKRVFAQESITLENNNWQLADVVVFETDGTRTFHRTYEWDTSLNFQDLKFGFASPDTLSLWELPKYIELLRKAGFSVNQFQVYFYNILMQPFIYLAMTLFGALVLYRTTVRSSKAHYIFLALASAFLNYILYSILSASGISNKITPLVAGIVPGIMSVLLAFLMILHFEEK